MALRFYLTTIRTAVIKKTDAGKDVVGREEELPHDLLYHSESTCKKEFNQYVIAIPTHLYLSDIYLQGNG
jgi:hypothetical protein